MRTPIVTLSVLLASAIVLGVLAGLGSSGAASDEPAATTYIIVRHAEKAGGETPDPELTHAGRERAAQLASMLRSMGVAGVYTTDYERTRQTAAPIAEMAGVKPRTYDPRDPGASLTRIGRAHEGGVVAIVGHSNTVPDLVRRLGGVCEQETLDDGEYDNVFVVVVLDSGRVLTHRLHGSPPSAAP